jgi:DNA-binding transcriptional LysR family regulator
MIQLLEAFCAVVDAGSINKAAEQLSVSQPALTRQLHALERQLGAVLLFRSPRGITLTPAGQAVLPHAREATAAVRACHMVAAEVVTGRTTRLRVAAGLMAMQYVLPPVVARFQALHPEIEVDLQATHQRVAVERLLGYAVDAAIIASPVHSPQVRATAILEDPLLLVCPPGTSDKPARLEDLHGCPLLVLSVGTGLYELIDSALRQRGVACTLVEYPTAETLKTAVALHMGVTLLPESAVRSEVAAGALVARRIDNWDGAIRVIHMLVRAEGRVPTRLQLFAGLLRQHYAGSPSAAQVSFKSMTSAGARRPAEPVSCIA